MKYIIFIIIGSVVANYQVDQMVTRLREKVGDDNTYGQQLAELIGLQLKQGGKVDNVLDQLLGILQSLNKDQNADDMVHALVNQPPPTTINQRMSQVTESASILESNFQGVTHEIQSTNKQIGDNSDEIAELSRSISTMSQQLIILTQREESIRQSKSEELSSFESRAQSNERLLNSITEIRKRLAQALLNQGQFIEKKERDILVNQIKSELGDSHPLAILVQMTARFDQATAQKIIDKLETLFKSIEKIQIEDKNNEELSQLNYLTLINEISTIRKNLSTDNLAQKSLLETRQQDLVMSQRFRDNLNSSLNGTDKLLLSTRSQLETIASTYLIRKNQKVSQIETIKQAQELISPLLEQLRA